MSSVLRKLVHDRFPKKWLMVVVLFVSAELPGTASGENPAPGTGAPSAFNGTTAIISFLQLASSPSPSVEIMAVPHRKHSLGLGACATRFSGAQANGQKERNTQ